VSGSVRVRTPFHGSDKPTGSAIRVIASLLKKLSSGFCDRAAKSGGYDPRGFVWG